MRRQDRGRPESVVSGVPMQSGAFLRPRGRSKYRLRLRKIVAMLSFLGLLGLLAFLAVWGPERLAAHRRESARREVGLGENVPPASPGEPASGQGGGQGSVRVPILVYHVVGLPRGCPGGLYVTPLEFREQVRYLVRSGYHAVTLGQAVEAWRGRGALPSRPVVITFDDGYVGDYLYALPELKKAQYVATVFLTVDRIGKKDGLTPGMVRDLIASGWELGSHTLSHADLTRLDSSQLRREVEESRLVLSRRFGVKVTSFCYPCGRFDSRVEEEVRRAGYLAACGSSPGLGDPREVYALRRIRVREGDGAGGLAAKLRLYGEPHFGDRPARRAVASKV